MDTGRWNPILNTQISINVRFSLNVGAPEMTTSYNDLQSATRYKGIMSRFNDDFDFLFLWGVLVDESIFDEQTNEIADIPVITSDK